MTAETDPSYALGHWYGLPRTTARVLALLYQRGQDAWTGRDDIGRVMVHPTPGGVCQHVSVLRQVLEAEAIDFAPGQGYRLTEGGVAECRAALRKLAGELLQAA